MAPAACQSSKIGSLMQVPFSSWNGMATLTRIKVSSQQASEPTLTSSVPTPFPVNERERLLQEDFKENLAKVQSLDNEETPPPEESTTSQEHSSEASHELLPSIASVQRSCIMTLNNLLSVTTNWSPIVPGRRHSMPSGNISTPTSQTDTVQSSSALQTLVSNLRNRDCGELMVESHPSHTESELLKELRARVESLSGVLDPADSSLALTLISLLSHFHRLTVIQPKPPPSRGSIAGPSSWSQVEPTEPHELFDTLKRQLSDLQLERLSQPDASSGSPVHVVEKALLWSKIDEELENVVSTCRERTEGLPRFSDQLPPQYDCADYLSDTPPEYQSGARLSIDDQDSKTRMTRSPSTTALNEKMRMDLEAVTMAIDRLYLVAPQLHNQRVELKSTKVEQMENARRAGGQSTSAPKLTVEGKQKAKDVKELDTLVDLLSKATERRFSNQSVVLEGGLDARLANSRLRDMKKRNAFVEQLVHHSDAGRLHAQDAVLPTIPKTKDPDALLSLPEFLRQSVPDSVRLADPNALLTLHEFFKESVPENTTIRAPMPSLPKSKKSRHRSFSAPPISWLRSSGSKSSGSSREAKSSRPHTSQCAEQSNIGFDVQYIAENHENLQHVLVFVTVTGADPSAEMEAEVLPSSPDSDQGDRLLVRNGPNTSFPLILPAHTSPGKKVVKAQSGHYEIKLSTSPFTFISTADSLPLLDASQLSVSSPATFTCASCSLPVVQSSNIETYRDLPSEHWEELVDAWMCHADQLLHERVAKRSRGFWPDLGQALVGGSYILFEGSSIVMNNLCWPDQIKRGEDWRRVRCICGAILGRCQEHDATNDKHATVYRLVKYAIRPTSAAAKPLKVPLSAFIVEDMNEFVQAHATYRFVILDEEEERPRILIWLFKPSIRLAYTVPVQYALPKSGSIHAAKVLYKIVGPSATLEDLNNILNKYPGFPQAEYLFYPITICRGLAALLKESNTAYPESMRTMMGLDVGWLRRA